MLNESRLFSFLDDNHGYSIHFLEGQKIIHDLAIIHGTPGQGFLFYRDIVLSVMQLTAFMKSMEGFGIYIDSETPHFRLKIEANESGRFRTLLLPTNFNESPQVLSGKVRVSKTFGKDSRPYTSILELKETDCSEIMNKVLKESYQIDGRIYLSPSSDQSVFIMKLPDLNQNKVTKEDRLNISEFWNSKKADIEKIWEKALNEEKSIIDEFTNLNMQYLSSKQIEFKCSCSRERMIDVLKGLANETPDSLFPDQKNSLEIKCDYCQTFYEILKNEVFPGILKQ